MKIKTQTVSTIEVDVELPYYSKYGSTFYKVISEELVIAVSAYKAHLEISRRSIAGCHAFSDEAVKITEEEFWLQYNEVKEQLYNITIGKELQNDNS